MGLGRTEGERDFWEAEEQRRAFWGDGSVGNFLLRQLIIWGTFFGGFYLVGRIIGLLFVR